MRDYVTRCTRYFVYRTQCSSFRHCRRGTCKRHRHERGENGKTEYLHSSHLFFLIVQLREPRTSRSRFLAKGLLYGRFAIYGSAFMGIAGMLVDSCWMRSKSLHLSGQPIRARAKGRARKGVSAKSRYVATKICHLPQALRPRGNNQPALIALFTCLSSCPSRRGPRRRARPPRVRAPSGVGARAGRGRARGRLPR
jgi:hypothetical protein